MLKYDEEEPHLSYGLDMLIYPTLQTTCKQMEGAGKIHMGTQARRADG